MANQPAKSQIYAIALIFIAVFFSNAVWAQKSYSKKAQKAYASAQDAFYMRDYQAANDYLNKAIAAEPAYAEAWLLKGELGVEVEDVDMAIDAYQKSFAIDSTLFPPSAITLSRLYDEKAEYDSAIKMLSWFLKNCNGNKANDLAAAELLENVIFRSHAVKNPVQFDPINMGSAINTNNDEYINILQFNGTELIFTRRMASTGGQRMEEALYVSKMEDGQWTTGEKLCLDWTYNDNMGAAFITADGKELYFTVCGLDEQTGCDLFSAIKSSGSWSFPNDLGQNVNSAAWDSQPSVSADGSELFFVSRRSGNADIYVSRKDQHGRWGEPENLGDVINTEGIEMAPYIHPDGRTLYFSSNKRTGMGGFDLFISRRNDDGAWQKPENLGYPINTKDDEINFIVAADGRTALISSFREGGFGGYDIYSFELQENFRPEAVTYVHAKVFDQYTSEAIPASAKFYDPLNGGLLYEFSSLDGDIFAVLPSRKSYSIEVASPGYLFYQRSVSPTESSELKPYALDVFLERMEVGKAVSLNNIQFEFNSSELTKNSVAGVVMLSEFLKRNPAAIVELAGHTDNLGAESYNQKLSYDRACVVRNELIVRGIASDRISAKGYGSTKPLFSNDSDENRALNRRTEMVIRKIQKQ
jgi:Outer membrane protein and related peptidoglycan-associated (lipo)proteins